jgi:hypothetical protein
MPEVNASIEMNTAGATRAASSRQNDKNHVGSLIMTADPYAKRTPDFYIGIFNVSRKEFAVPRPWAVNGVITIPARPEDGLYGKPFILRDVEATQKLQPGSDEILMIPVKGAFLAQDIVNCNDPLGDWKTYKTLNPATALNEGNNYYDRGIFWVKLASPDAEPDIEAVEAAVNRLEAYYNSLILEGNRYYSSGPKTQSLICDPHHMAADYFISAGNDLELPWHQVLSGGMKSRIKAKKVADSVKWMKPAAEKAPPAAPKV